MVVRTVATRPGFRCSIFQLSNDRTHVVNDAQRDSARVASASPYEIVAAFAPEG